MQYISEGEKTFVLFEGESAIALIPDINNPLHIVFNDYVSAAKACHCAFEYAKMRGKPITYTHRDHTATIKPSPINTMRIKA